jgi:Sugar-transfer associated ATP-grasp
LPTLKSAVYALDALRGASARYGQRYSDLVRRFLHLYRKRRFSPYEIHFNDLLNPRIPDEGLRYYMSKEEMFDFDERHVLNGYFCVTADKAVFYSLCMAAGIPAPRLLAVFDQPVGWVPDGRVLRSRSDWGGFLQTLPEDFVVKPALGLLGKGVAAFHREANGFVDHEGGKRTLDELYEFLCRAGEQNFFSSTGYSHYSLKLPRASNKTIIQERLYAHPGITELTGSRTLCTCRLFTHIDHAGNFRLLGSAFRVVGGSAFVDNFDVGRGGNLWCSVDPETGRIEDAFGRPPGGNRLELAYRHPVTGRDVVGFRIPDWSEAVELGQRLAHLFLPQPLITWDIGVSRDGPVAIEGNVGAIFLPARLNVRVPALLKEV